MISKAKIRQLENKYNLATNQGFRSFVVRHIVQDGRLVDENGYLLTRNEIKEVEKENKEIENQNGLIISLETYCEPKERQ